MTTTLTPPPTTVCDHSVASHGANRIPASQWMTHVRDIGRAVAHWNTSSRALPHYGFLRLHSFCTDCGARVDSKKLHGAFVDAMGTPADPAMTHDDYMSWHDGLFTARPDAASAICSVDDAAPED